MWKTLLLTFFVFGLTAGLKFESKTKTQQRVKASLEAECKKYDDKDKTFFVSEEAMHAIECWYNSFASANTTLQMRGPYTKEIILDQFRQVCKIRVALRGCVHALLHALLPCASTSVQAQVEDLKKAITELFDFFCEDNCKRVSDFLEDGGYECLEDKSKAADACATKVNELFSDPENIPEDTTTNEAFDACHRYDEMMVCTQNVFSECPKPSTKKFIQEVLTKFRKGTYCHVTVPLPETPATHENNQL